jgi:hypothetical protein
MEPLKPFIIFIIYNFYLFKFFNKNYSKNLLKIKKFLLVNFSFYYIK